MAGPAQAQIDGQAEAPEPGQTATNSSTPTGVHVRSSSHTSRHDEVAMLNSLTVKEGDEVLDAVVIGGTAHIDGKVRGDCVVVFGKASLGPKAEVRGDLVVVGGSADIDPAAKISGDRVILGIGGMPGMPGLPLWIEDWFTKGLFWGRLLPPQVAWCWAVAGVFLLLYLLTAVLFPRPLRASVQALEAQPAGAFLAGFLALLLVGPLVTILAISVVGLILVPLVACGLLVIFFFGKVVFYRYAGQQLGRGTGLEFLQQPVVALVVGTILFYLLYAVPVLGIMVWGIIAPFGLGAVLLACFKGMRPEPVQGAPAAAVAGSVPPVTSGQPAGLEPATALTYPRAGFWMRFVATLIDFILVGLFIALSPFHAPFFIFLWTAYHIAMWTWKGTTIGGMVFGLKIVRTDGQPINFAVALVRGLSAFLSAAALFLGFFWAGWDRDKQAWHDKIAGTYIVKMPRGVSML